MSLRTLFARAPKRVWASALMLAAVIIVPASVLAWGPGRETYTMQNPASVVALNSMTDNTAYGAGQPADERQFVNIKDAADTTAGNWQNSVAVQEGREYLVRVYVHNDAAENLKLVALNTRVEAALSRDTGTKTPLTVYASADNAVVKKVHADVYMTSDKQFNIAYVPGSARIYNNATGPSGRAVSDSIVNGGGTQIGYEANNGELPGCLQYASYVYFKVKPQFAPSTDFTVSKQVRMAGTKTWSESLAVKTGDTVEYIIGYQNKGKIQQNNVTFRDTLPAGMTYVPGSTLVYNTANNGVKISDNLVTSTGVNIGNYAPEAGAYVTFKAKVTATNSSLEVCGTNKLTNVGKVTTDYGTKQDTADVTINKECVETAKACEIKTGNIVTVDKTKIDNVNYTLDLSKCEKKETPVEKCPIPGKEHLPKNSPECKETVVTPPAHDTPAELPHTGVTGSLMQIIGAGSLVGLSAAYIASRRNLSA